MDAAIARKFKMATMKTLSLFPLRIRSPEPADKVDKNMTSR